MGISYDEAGEIACIVLGVVIVTILVFRFAVRRRQKSLR
jgi:hypothetical protein